MYYYVNFIFIRKHNQKMYKIKKEEITDELKIYIGWIENQNKVLTIDSQKINTFI